MSIDEKQFQAFEPDVEQKAFIYQQVHELEDQVKNLGGLMVFVEKEEVIDSQTQKELDHKFAVTFVIDPENLNLKVRAESDDLYSACLSAKAVTQSKVFQLINHKGTDEHAQQMLDAVNGGNGWMH